VLQHPQTEIRGEDPAVSETVAKVAKSLERVQTLLTEGGKFPAERGDPMVLNPPYSIHQGKDRLDP
jgi:hypothetical protein